MFHLALGIGQADAGPLVGDIHLLLPSRAPGHGDLAGLLLQELRQKLTLTHETQIP